MSLIDEKPKDLPSTNTLDDVDDPDLNQHGLSIDRYLAFGTTPRALPNPPKDGEVVVYKVKVECVGQAHKRRSDGEVRYRSDLEILSVARVDQELPPDFEKTSAKRKTKAQQDAEAEAAAADDQPPLFDEDGGASDEDYYDDGDEDQGDDNTLAAAEAEDEDEDDDNVVPFSGGPSFSDNNSDD